MNVAHLDHVGLLVESAEKSAEHFRSRNLEVGPTEDFPSEGTREIYVGSRTQHGKVLLIEAIGPGPYLSALERRGPGLHHVALGVPDIRSFVTGLMGSGWHLHPISLTALAHTSTVWLARAGTPVLIELSNSTAPASQESLVTRLGLPIPDRLVRALSCPIVEEREDITIEVGDWRFCSETICT